MNRFASSAAFALALILSACATSSSTKGSVASGVYIGPLGNLRVPVPKLGPGQRLQDGIKHSPDLAYHIGLVSFYDDFGHLRSITYENLPPEWIDRQEDPGTMRKVNELLFDTIVVKPTSANMPGTEVSHAQGIDDADGVQYFAVVDIPGGSTLSAQKQGSSEPAKRHDVQRAYLVFTEKGYSYVLCMVTDPSGKTPGKLATEEQVEQWREELRAFRHTLQLSSPPPPQGKKP